MGLVVRRYVAGLLICTLAGGSRAQAQEPGWHLTADVAVSHVGGGALGVSEGDEVTLRPHRPTVYGVRIERLGRRVGLGLAVRYAAPAFALDGTSLSVIDHDAGFSLIELAPELSLRLAGTSSGVTLRGRAGPVVDIWSWDVTENVARLGGRGGLGLDVPLGSRFAAAINGAVVVSGSMFAAEDVAPDFEPRTSIRTELGLGLRYALR